jgi:hypothetical protein
MIGKQKLRFEQKKSLYNLLSQLTKLREAKPRPLPSDIRYIIAAIAYHTTLEMSTQKLQLQGHSVFPRSAGRVGAAATYRDQADQLERPLTWFRYDFVYSTGVRFCTKLGKLNDPAAAQSALICDHAVASLPTGSTASPGPLCISSLISASSMGRLYRKTSSIMPSKYTSVPMSPL